MIQEKEIEKEIQWLLQEKYQGQLTPAAKRDIEKLRKGYPLDYLIGNKPFLNTIIDLHFRPLIPRVETEFWVSQLIQQLKKQSPNKEKIQCLDIFAGSGCIGIALLKNIPWLNVDFGEKNAKFIQQIKVNLQLNNISKERYRVIKTNIFQNIKKKYNLIVANPPYISPRRKKSVQKEVLQYEPSSALFAKDNGLFFIQQVIKKGRKHLLSSGTLYLEFDSWQKISIEKILKKTGITHFNFYRDQYHRWRWLTVEHSPVASLATNK